MRVGGGFRFPSGGLRVRARASGGFRVPGLGSSEVLKMSVLDLEA